MAYNYPKVKMVDGRFGPTIIGHFYKPAYYHNKKVSGNPNKSHWLLKQNEQYEVFRLADEGQWLDKGRNGLYSIINDGEEILGLDGECLAFFPSPANNNDPWHGYPTDSKDMSDELKDQWYEDKIVSEITYRRLLRCAI